MEKHFALLLSLKQSSDGEIFHTLGLINENITSISLNPPLREEKDGLRVQRKKLELIRDGKAMMIAAKRMNMI